MRLELQEVERQQIHIKAAKKQAEKEEDDRFRQEVLISNDLVKTVIDKHLTTNEILPISTALYNPHCSHNDLFITRCWPNLRKMIE